MGAAKYTTEFIGELGSEFKIEIWDRDYASTTTEFKTFVPGFTLSYQGSGDDELNPVILGSECTVHLKVDSASMRTFIESLVNISDDEKYGIKIYKDSSLWWVGYIRYDGQEFLDQYYPYQFDLKATDGLGLLSDSRFPQLYVPNPLYSHTTDPVNRGRLTITDIIMKCLWTTRIEDMYGADDKYLQFAISWNEEYLVFNSTFNPSQDDFPFNELTIHPYNLQDNKTEDVPLNDRNRDALFVLKKICTLFHLRVKMVNGYFSVEQINTKALTSYDIVSLKKNGDEISTITSKLQNNNYIALEGGGYRYINALRSSFIRYATEIWDTIESTYQYVEDAIVDHQNSNIDPVSELPIKVRNKTTLDETNVGTTWVLYDENPNYIPCGQIFTLGRNLTTWPPGVCTKFWADPDLDTAKAVIEEALLIEINASRKKPVKIYRAEIQSTDYDPDQTLLHDSEDYLFMIGTFTAHDEIWSCEWWEMQIDRSNMELLLSDNATEPELPTTHPSEEY